MKKQNLPPEYSNQAKKYINKQDKPTKQRIKKAIEEIPIGDIVPYEGSESSFRLRKGDFRIIFSWLSDGQILVEKIKPRGDVYKGV